MTESEDRPDDGFQLREVDLYGLFRRVERQSAAFGNPLNGLWIRLSPEVPTVLKIDEARFAAYMNRIAALGAIAGDQNARVIDVQLKQGAGPEAVPLYLRIEIRHSPTLPAGLSEELHATGGITYMPEGPVGWFEVPAWPSDRPIEIKPYGRVLMLGKETESLFGYGELLKDVGLRVQWCAELEEALREISAPPTEAPVRLMVVDGGLLKSYQENSRLQAFVKRVRSASIPICVGPGEAPSNDELREIGVGPQLPSPNQEIARNMLALSPGSLDLGGDRVSQPERWRWRDRQERPRAILIADDIEAVRMVLARVLESLGYIAHTARSGEEALTRLLDNSLHRYQAAILDISMPPGISGPTVIKRYRERRPSSKMPIIILTANDSPDSQMLAADAGADAYLAKPVSADLLKSTLEQLLSASDQDFHDEPIEVPELPTIDWTVLAEIEGLYSSEAELVHVLSVFARDAEEQVVRLEAAARERIPTALYMPAQALKSLAAGLGATRLSDTARRIEGLRDLPARGDLDSLIAQAKSDLADVLALLSGLKR